MGKKIFILISFVLLFKTILIAQCPDRNAFLQQMNQIFESSKLSVSEKTSALLIKLDGIENCPYKNDSIHAMLLRYVGGLYYSQKDFFNAIKYYNQCIDLIRANYNSPAIDRKYLLACYIWLNVFYDSLGNHPKRMDAVDKCIETGKELNSYADISCVEALLIKTENCFDIGDYHNCINYATMCEKFAWECAEANKNNSDKSDFNQANHCALNSLGWHAEALLRLNDYKTASILLNENLEKYKTKGSKIYYGMIYDQLAQVEMHNKDYKKALSLLNQSLKSEEDVRNYFNYKQELNTIAHDIYFSYYNDNDKAIDYYRKALGYSYRDKQKLQQDSMESLHIYDRMAMAYVNEHLFESAFKHFQLAFDQIKPGVNETDVSNFSMIRIKQLRKIDYLTTLLIDKGDAFEKQYEITSKADALSKAIRMYKISDKFLDSIKNVSFDLRSKLFWRLASQRLYENAIHACYLQQNLEDAFYFFEKSRAVLLNDDLNKQHWVGEDDIMKETQLEKKILQIQQMMNNTGKSSKNYSQLENDLFNSRQDFQKLKEIIKTNNPLYYQSFFEKNFITIKDVQSKILKDHQALFELFEGDSAVYTITITPQKALLQKIDKKLFDSLSSSFTRYLADEVSLNKKYGNFIQLSQQLYELVFKNAGVPAGRIIISPNGKYFPFEALVTNAKPLAYFLDDHAISYTYSARYLMNQFNANATNSSYTFMGIAPVRYPSLPTLSGSDHSLQLIRNYFGNIATLTGANASRNNFINDYYKYKIIQLYTHATDSGFSGEPVIYFSDSALSMSDLFYENKPLTSLIVLSACETANGKLYNGEGVFSFSRQFAALGIPSSISNLWQANNESSYKITELFYKYLSRGLPLDVALQKAKNEFREISSKEKSLPYYWAAPILVGQTHKIPLQQNFPWKWVGAAVILILMIAAGIWVWQKRKTSYQTTSITKKEISLLKKRSSQLRI